jgi:glycosyltransferase involved in cell wall biosynthesis
VVDGGSTDGTFERLASRPDIELVRQRGRGLAAARNQGVASLHTDLVAFCDADDRWVTGGLGARLRHLCDHSACAVVAGAVVMHVVDGHRAPPARVAQLHRPLPGYTPGALLVRRSVFHTVGWFDERLQIAADSAWFARLLESDLRFDRFDEVVLVKGVRSRSLSTDLDRYRSELLGVVRGHLRATRVRPST